MREIQAIGERLIVERVKAERFVGSILLPDSALSKRHLAKVLSVGKGVEGIAVGDLVVFGKYSGVEWIERDDEAQVHELVILHQDEVLLVQGGKE